MSDAEHSDGSEVGINIWGDASPPMTPKSGVPEAGANASIWPVQSPIRTEVCNTPDYIRDLIKVLDATGAVADLDLNDETAVCNYVMQARLEETVAKVARLYKLRDTLSEKFSDRELTCIGNQVAKEWDNLPAAHREQATGMLRMKRRADILEHVVQQGLLSDTADSELFREIIRVTAAK